MGESNLEARIKALEVHSVDVDREVKELKTATSTIKDKLISHTEKNYELANRCDRLEDKYETIMNNVSRIAECTDKIPSMAFTIENTSKKVEEVVDDNKVQNKQIEELKNRPAVTVVGGLSKFWWLIVGALISLLFKYIGGS